jgi:hypothetical protein
MGKTRDSHSSRSGCYCKVLFRCKGLTSIFLRFSLHLRPKHLVWALMILLLIWKFGLSAVVDTTLEELLPPAIAHLVSKHNEGGLGNPTLPNLGEGHAACTSPKPGGELAKSPKPKNGGQIRKPASPHTHKSRAHNSRKIEVRKRNLHRHKNTQMSGASRWPQQCSYR